MLPSCSESHKFFSHGAMNPQELVRYWILERERIRTLKAAGNNPPWSTDSIFVEYRFCNVHREDDRVTQWLRQHWREPFHAHPNLTLAMALARFLNWPPTLAALGFPEKWQSDRVFSLLDERKRRGQQIWNGAYMITTCGKTIDKNQHLVEVLTRLECSGLRPRVGDTLAGFHQFLCRIDGIGSFLAAQIVADLKCVPGNPLGNASDFWTWAAPGPGSERGLRWYLGREKPIAAREFLPALTRMAEEVTPLLNGIEPLTAQDWQSVMCEVDKYARAMEGRGRPKQRYNTTARAYSS